jgi:hypothetical protein
MRPGGEASSDDFKGPGVEAEGARGAAASRIATGFSPIPRLIVGDPAPRSLTDYLWTWASI